MKITNILVYILVIGAVLGAGYYYLSMQKPPQQSDKTAQVQENQNNAKEFMMTAKQFEFSPSEIRVKLGDRVRIKLTGQDVEHGFAMPDYNLNVKLDPNVETVVDFVASKKGTFSFFCNVPCGEGHKEMKGTLMVE